ncbi:MarR family winged helix-turn-helix transcriptional regulator [Microbacterium sp.]|uniref:MarR family winged helix-turn-helix transcriptional regulator n=1 Tax=Microbacterium sp. TaxID=51671 RepID=UPI002FE15EBE
MVQDTRVSTDDLVSGVEEFRRADAQLTRRLAAMRAPNDTDRAAVRFIAAAPADAPVTPGSLATHLGVSTAAITSLIRRLQERGQVVVARHPDDARSKVLRASLRDLHSPVDDLGRRVEALADEFSPEHLEAVTRFFRRLAEEVAELP